MSELSLNLIFTSDLGWCVDTADERISLDEFYKREAKKRSQTCYIRRYALFSDIIFALLKMGYVLTLAAPKEEDNVQTQED